MTTTHRHLHNLQPIDAEHCDRWFSLWTRSVDERWEGPNAERAKSYAAALMAGLAKRSVRFRLVAGAGQLVIRAIVGFHADESGRVGGRVVLSAQPARASSTTLSPAGVGDDTGRAGGEDRVRDRLSALRSRGVAGGLAHRSHGRAVRRGTACRKPCAPRIASPAERGACFRLIEGGAGIQIAATPPIDRWLTPGAAQPIPPLVPHHLMIDGAVVLAVDFLVADPETTPPELLGRRHLDAGSECLAVLRAR